MTKPMDSTSLTLYQQDYALWLETTINQLRRGNFAEVDWENLLEELEGMNRSDKRALESLLTRLLEHLLKLTHWESERRDNANKWKSEITNFRNQIKKLLKDSPSLNPHLREVFSECYSDARESMSLLIGTPLPASCGATLEQVLDKGWFPDSQQH